MPHVPVVAVLWDHRPDLQWRFSDEPLESGSSKKFDYLEKVGVSFLDCPLASGSRNYRHQTFHQMEPSEVLEVLVSLCLPCNNSQIEFVELEVDCCDYCSVQDHQHLPVHEASDTVC